MIGTGQDQGRRVLTRQLIGTIAVGMAVFVAVPAAFGIPGWGAPRELIGSDDAFGNAVEQPGLLVTLDHIYVAYKKQGLYLLRSGDGGKTWVGPFPIVEDLVFNIIPMSEQDPLSYAPDYAPALFETRETLEAVWSEYVDNNYVLRHSMSLDHGETWEKPITLLDPGDHAFTPRALKVRNRFYLVWFQIQPTGESFRGRRSMDPRTIFGKQKEWEKQRMLTPGDINTEPELYSKLSSTDFVFSLHLAEIVPKARALRQIYRYKGDKPVIPRVFTAVSDGNDAIYILWNEGRAYRSVRTTNFGESFLVAELGAKLEPHMLATFAFAGGQFHLVQIPFRPFTPVDLQYSRGTGGGEQVQLLGNIYTLETPKTAVSGSDVHVVFAAKDDRSSTITYLRTDTVPPEAKFVSPSSAIILTPTMTVQWTGVDNYSWTDRLVYRFHNLVEWLPFSNRTELLLKTPVDGTYSLQVQARDEAGNVQEKPTVFQFDTSRVAPATIITSDVPPIVRTRSLRVAWTGSDNSTPVEELEYSHRLDSRPWSEFTRETEALFTGLNEGRHVIEVRSRDDKGNVEQVPQRLEFEVRLNIALQFLSPPPQRPINSRQVTLEWEGRDETGESNVTYYYSYRVNYGAWSEETIDNRLTLTLDEGTHTIEIRARDETGNQSVENLKYTCTVDVTPPETEPIPTVREYTTLGYPRVRLAAKDNQTDPDQIRFVWSRDGSTWETSDNPRELQVPVPVRWYSKGYEVHVAAVDAAGNQDPTPASISYRLFDRNPAAKLYLGGLAALVVVGVVTALVVTFQKARAAARRRRLRLEREAEYAASSSPLAFAQAGAKTDVELEAEPTAGVAEPALTQEASIPDPFSSDQDPFASSQDPFAGLDSGDKDTSGEESADDPFASKP